MSNPIQEAMERRDQHIRDVLEWHFNPETGSPFWLSQMPGLGFDPRTEIQGFDDLVLKFPNFDGDKFLRTVSMEEWKPKGFPNERWTSVITGGTTGEPKRRLTRRGTEPGTSDFADDYFEFAKLLPKEGFAQGGTWLYLGPQGPRRLKRGVEVLANVHQANLIEIDFDAPWMKATANTVAEAYKHELVVRAIGALRRDKPDKVFCPPILIQAIGEIFDWSKSGVKGVFAGGTEMSPETVRVIMEELFRGQVSLVPVYGNALAGLAPPRPIATERCPISGQTAYQVIYQPLEPRTLLRVTQKGDSSKLVPYGEFGYVEITLASFEFLMPRFLERDWARRIIPTDAFPSDGVAEVQLPPELKGKLTVGVY